MSPANVPSTSAKRVAFKDTPQPDIATPVVGGMEPSIGSEASDPPDSPATRGRSNSDVGAVEPITVLHEMDDIDADFQFADIGFVEMEADEYVARRIQHEFGRYDSFVSTDENGNSSSNSGSSSARARTASAGESQTGDDDSPSADDALNSAGAAANIRPDIGARNSKSPPTIARQPGRMVRRSTDSIAGLLQVVVLLCFTMQSLIS